MTTTEQRRAWILTRVLKGERTMVEAAETLGLSERQLWRLRTAFERDGPAGWSIQPPRSAPTVADQFDAQ